MSLAVLAAAALLVTVSPKPPPTAAAAEPAPSGLVKPADAEVMGSCRVGKSTCVDFSGRFAGPAGGTAEARCKKLKGTWSAEACPEAGLVGTCTERDTGSQDKTLTRTYAPTTAKAARAECKKTARGVFLAK